MLLSFIDINLNLRKIFLDIFCMVFVEDGRFLGVLKDVLLMLLNFSKLYECYNLEVLNIGLGLWYCMEMNVEMLILMEKWFFMSIFILYMIF